jgi:predicted regulator of Ras-like GTPase activity (Roadblock/LC7/MglB family)
MNEPANPIEHDAIGDRSAEPPEGSSRSHQIKESVGALSRLEHVRGSLMVTPDGFVITADLPGGSPLESLAALGATLGRELELGAERLGRGKFKTALFSGGDGTIFVGGTSLGFVLLLADPRADVSSLRSALGQALDRLHC